MNCIAKESLVYKERLELFTWNVYMFSDSNKSSIRTWYKNTHDKVKY